MRSEAQMRARVSQAAIYLELSERELFDRAYRATFPGPPPDGRLERDYEAYTCRGTVPSWMVQFIAQVDDRRAEIGIGRRLIDGLDATYEWALLAKLIYCRPRPRMPRTDLVT
ncbi:MAG: hypothetical protein AAF493_08630 [Pseudomonadota bacterium]